MSRGRVLAQFFAACDPRQVVCVLQISDGPILSDRQHVPISHGQIIQAAWIQVKDSDDETTSAAASGADELQDDVSPAPSDHEGFDDGDVASLMRNTHPFMHGRNNEEMLCAVWLMRAMMLNLPRRTLNAQAGTSLQHLPRKGLILPRRTSHGLQ